jgi:DNA-binding response OmpR family regulator
MTKILIVDDEPAMREGLADNLEFEGYETEMAANGKEGLDMIMSRKYDLVVLDVMMPEMSGFDVCKELRKRNVAVPVILLTAKGEEIDKVLGLELGADDYITKPFSLRELIARIKAILRRAQPSTGKEDPGKYVNIGLMQVDFTNYKAWIADKEVKLSHREFEILHFLWDHKQEVVSRDDLLKNIWEYDEFPTTRTVDNFILKLRQKIEKNPNVPEIIITVHGVGYKLL